MQALRQKVRPKHQVLILKCYPRLSKNSAVAEIRPNGSELSYLLYYASSRRSKLSKVGAFLEHRTDHDLQKLRTMSVQITLSILTAFLNNPAIGGAGPAGFDLFAPFVLRMLKDVLQRPTETVLVEDALATWSVFCTRQDHVLLSADAEYRDLFTSVVRLWAGFAKRSTPGDRRRGLLRSAVKVGHGVGDAIRLRTAGLQALKSLSDSDTLATEAGQQLEILIPILCQTLQGHDGNLHALVDMQQQYEVQDKEKAAKGRPSMAPSRLTTESVNPRAAEGTAADADRLADQEADILALQCLKSMCIVENRVQIRATVLCLLKYITTIEPPSSARIAGIHESWSIKLFETICRWIPVQDRFLAVFGAVQALVRGISSSTDDFRRTMPSHLLLSRLIAHVLDSDINFIGLSVMDSMLGLLQSTLRIFRQSQQMASSSTTSTPGPTPIDSTRQDEQRLIAQLHQCITNLAVHIYYTDQISDMVSALLATTTNDYATPLSQFAFDRDSSADNANSEDGVNVRANSEGASCGSQQDFARQVTLDAVRDIIVVANAGATHTGYVADGRNNVPVSVWEGTQWLLRDPCQKVRQSYIDALCTWLRLELRKSDVLPEQDLPMLPSRARPDQPDASLKAVPGKTTHAKFLQGLHVAMFDNAMQLLGLPDADEDVLLLHLLLFRLAKGLGLNAARVSLPMVMALQDNLSTLSHQALVRAGSLVYGYLQTLCHVFSIHEPSVEAEIRKRTSLGLWTAGVQTPPLFVREMRYADISSPVEPSITATDGLTPFNDRTALVKQLITAHLRMPHSPSTSISSSPARTTLPGTPIEPIAASQRRKSEDTDNLPQSFIDDLSSTWSRDSVLASPVGDIRSGSFSSFTGLTSKSVKTRPASTVIKDYLVANWDHRQLLGAATSTSGGRLRSHSRDSSPKPDPMRTASLGKRSTSRTSRIVSTHSRHSVSPDESVNGRLSGGYSPAFPRRSGDSMIPSSHQCPVKVEDLKRVLASGGVEVGIPLTDAGIRSEHFYHDDAISESMVDVDESFGEFGYEEEDEDDQLDQTIQADENEMNHVQGRDFAGQSVVAGGDIKTPPETQEEFHVRKTRLETGPVGIAANADRSSPKQVLRPSTELQWSSDRGLERPAGKGGHHTILGPAIMGQTATNKDNMSTNVRIASRASADELRDSAAPAPGRTTSVTTSRSTDGRLSHASSNGNIASSTPQSASYASMSGLSAAGPTGTASTATARRHLSGASTATNTSRYRSSLYRRHAGKSSSINGSGAGGIGHGSSGSASLAGSIRGSTARLASLLASVHVDEDDFHDAHESHHDDDDDDEARHAGSSDAGKLEVSGAGESASPRDDLTVVKGHESSSHQSRGGLLDAMSPPY